MDLPAEQDGLFPIRLCLGLAAVVALQARPQRGAGAPLNPCFQSRSPPPQAQSGPDLARRVWYSLRAHSCSPPSSVPTSPLTLMSWGGWGREEGKGCARLFPPGLPRAALTVGSCGSGSGGWRGYSSPPWPCSQHHHQPARAQPGRNSTQPIPLHPTGRSGGTYPRALQGSISALLMSPDEALAAPSPAPISCAPSLTAAGGRGRLRPHQCGSGD